MVMLYLLLGIHFFTCLISQIMRKKNSMVFAVKGITGSLFYVFETSILGLFYFCALNGFRLHFNRTVVLYGLLYGIVVIATLIPSIFLYNYASFAFISFISSCLSLVFSLLSGRIFFGEVISEDKLMRIILMLAAAAVIFAGRRLEEHSDNENREKHRKKLFMALLLILFSALVGTMGTAVMKFYMLSEQATDQNSFFFITNIFSAALVLPIFPFVMKRDSVRVKDIWDMVKTQKTLYAAITTMNSNIGSIVQIMILSIMDVSVYTPLSSAMVFVAIIAATPLIGEKLNKYVLIAAVLAILSVVLPWRLLNLLPFM